MENTALIMVNFGGPRNIDEVPEFLTALLTDKDVIRTPLPGWIQDFLFRRIAKKRSQKVSKDYLSIGGKSPIYEDTEWVSKAVEGKIGLTTLVFHRYIPETHADFIREIQKVDADVFLVFPFFPQFSYATTGSIARFFAKHLPVNLCQKMQWVPSYSTERQFIDAFEKNIKEFLDAHHFQEKETAFLFSAHGLPKQFIVEGDPYQKECEESFALLSSKFPLAYSLLSYQSQFGKAEWIKPSTIQSCQNVHSWIGDKKQIVMIPLSFTSDHIETLFEMEEEYIRPLQEQGYSAYRCPALGRNSYWIDAICEIIKDREKVPTNNLIRRD